MARRAASASSINPWPARAPWLLDRLRRQRRIGLSRRDGGARARHLLAVGGQELFSIGCRRGQKQLEATAELIYGDHLSAAAAVGAHVPWLATASNGLRRNLGEPSPTSDSYRASGPPLGHLRSGPRASLGIDRAPVSSANGRRTAYPSPVYKQSRRRADARGGRPDRDVGAVHTDHERRLSIARQRRRVRVQACALRQLANKSGRRAVLLSRRLIVHLPAERCRHGQGAASQPRGRFRQAGVPPTSLYPANHANVIPHAAPRHAGAASPRSWSAGFMDTQPEFDDMHFSARF